VRVLDAFGDGLQTEPGTERENRADDRVAALALTEAVTRLADRPNPVSDEVWEEAARHYDDDQMGALVLSIATINTWNRLNAATRQVTGEWVEELVAAQAAGAPA